MVRLSHNVGFYGGVLRVGGPNTYIKVDTTNKKIEFYIDGTLVQEWS